MTNHSFCGSIHYVGSVPIFANLTVNIKVNGLNLLLEYAYDYAYEIQFEFSWQHRTKYGFIGNTNPKFRHLRMPKQTRVRPQRNFLFARKRNLDKGILTLGMIPSGVNHIQHTGNYICPGLFSICVLIFL